MIDEKRLMGKHNNLTKCFRLVKSLMICLFRGSLPVFFDKGMGANPSRWMAKSLRQRPQEDADDVPKLRY